MCQKESWGAIVALKEAHSTQRDQTTENARAWVGEVRAKGTKSNPCSNERSELRSLVPGVGQQRSDDDGSLPEGRFIGFYATWG